MTHFARHDDRQVGTSEFKVDYSMSTGLRGYVMDFLPYSLTKDEIEEVISRIACIGYHAEIELSSYEKDVYGMDVKKHSFGYREVSYDVAESVVCTMASVVTSSPTHNHFHIPHILLTSIARAIANKINSRNPIETLALALKSRLINDAEELGIEREFINPATAGHGVPYTHMQAMNRATKNGTHRKHRIYQVQWDMAMGILQDELHTLSMHYADFPVLYMADYLQVEGHQLEDILHDMRIKGECCIGEHHLQVMHRPTASVFDHKQNHNVWGHAVRFIKA